MSDVCKIAIMLAKPYTGTKCAVLNKIVKPILLYGCEIQVFSNIAQMKNYTFKIL